MDINTLTDEQKSVMLVRLSRPLGDGCPAVYDDESDYEFLADAGECSCEGKNLYNPLNMQMAWQVLNWFMTQSQWIYEWADNKLTFVEHIDDVVKGASRLPPAEAQRAWLDKILGLAIEAGLVEPD